MALKYKKECLFVAFIDLGSIPCTAPSHFFPPNILSGIYPWALSFLGIEKINGYQVRHDLAIKKPTPNSSRKSIDT